MSVPAWEKCEGCGEMLCNIHDCHTGDSYCDCPSLEAWEVMGIDPYSAGGHLTPKSLQALLPRGVE